MAGLLSNGFNGISSVPLAQLTQRYYRPTYCKPARVIQQGARLPERSTAVEVAIAPPLRDDHQVRLIVNGEISQTALHSDVFWLTGLPAGQHELQAELLDSSQRLQHRTPAVTITVP